MRNFGATVFQEASALLPAALFPVLVQNADASRINSGLHQLFSFHLQEQRQHRDTSDTCCEAEAAWVSPAAPEKVNPLPVFGKGAVQSGHGQSRRRR